WIDPIAKSGFPEKWTLFFWAWWIVYAPFVGLFIAKISRGRTIRQMIFGTIVFGSLGCWLFYLILGNYGLFLQSSGGMNVTGIMEMEGPHKAIVAILRTLPAGNLM